MAGRRRHRIVDGDDRQRADRVATRLHEIHLGDLLVERTTGERHAEGALLEAARLLLEPGRAAILALVVAPDAVIRLIEGADEVGPEIGQGEALAVAMMLRPEAQHGDAMHDLALDRHEMLHVEAMRHLEEDAAPMRLLSRRRQRRPGGVACGEIEVGGALGLLLHPLRDVAGEDELRQRLAETRFELCRQGRAVDCGCGFRGHALHGAALHEEPLHRIDRRQLMVAVPARRAAPARCRTARR